MDNPSTDLVDTIISGASRLTDEKVLDFVGIAARILKTYASRPENTENAIPVWIIIYLIYYHIVSLCILIF